MTSPSRVLTTALAVGLLVFAGVIVRAQEFRGSISGKITESSGAAVPNATVIVTSASTNASVTSTTNEAGDFTVLYLTPGSYRVTVEAKGFKKSKRDDIEVRVGDRLSLEIMLEVGNVNETVNVTAESPLLDTSSASAGQVIDRRRIADLPLSDGNPFVLTRLTPGVAYTGDLLFSRPFDNAGTASIVADGAPGRNEFTIDGTPNMAHGGGVGRVAFVPPAEAVQEFKVETASFDGQQAHTAGATVNVTLRSGTNSLHGSLYEFVRNDKLSANDFFLNRSAPDKDGDGKADRTALRYNRYGGTVGGPIYLPPRDTRSISAFTMRSTRPGKLSSSQDFSIGRSISLTRSSSVRALLLSTVWARELKADSTAETVDCARIGCWGGSGGASKSTGA